MAIILYHEHPWDLSPGEAERIQEELRGLVRVEPLPEAGIRRIGGVDAGFAGEKVYAAVVVLNYATMEPVDQALVEIPVTFPYIPGLLSFREAPGILAALARLKHLPDVLLVDGHGIAHPRRFGIACHLGVLLDLPAIGCAKSVLVGQVGSLSEAAGSTAELTAGKEVLGMAVRTRQKVKPVYVSTGHRVDLPSAVRIVLACGRGYRLPEPTRHAHQFAAAGKLKPGIK